MFNWTDNERPVLMEVGVLGCLYGVLMRHSDDVVQCGY